VTPPDIEMRVKRTLTEIPDTVALVAAAKTRTPEEIDQALRAGVRIVGMNYVQEAASAVDSLGRSATQWHMIGHLQRNKVRESIHLFDCIQTVDSLRLARKIDAEASAAGIVMPVLIEVNSASEAQKAGVAPEETLDFLRELSALNALRVDGLMTMGPLVENPEAIRPYFRLTKALFDEARTTRIEGIDLRVLSMGMSDSYRVAIEEGATMVRLGTTLFGPRSASR